MKKKTDAPFPAVVDRDILLFVVLTLVMLVGAESFAVAWALNKAAAATGGIVAQPDRLLAFAKWISLIILPLTAVNAAIGVLIAREFSTPLIRMRAAMNEIARGNLEHELPSDSWDALEGYTLDCRNMLGVLRRLVYRDRQSARDASAYLEQCHALLAEAHDAAGRKKIVDLLNLARSELSIVNHHFTKGLKETP